MAVFQSIVLGSSKGSIGNVTTAKLKGQNIAKAKITSTTNVNSTGQVTSRGKMSNIVMAFQFLSIFLADATALRKSTESVYNAFVRIFKTSISDTIALSRALAAALLEGIVVEAGNFVNIVSVAVATTSYTVAFNTSGLPFSANTYLKVISWNSADGNQSVASHLITEAEWTAETITLAGALSGATNQGAYIYNVADKKNSNILFS